MKGSECITHGHHRSRDKHGYFTGHGALQRIEYKLAAFTYHGLAPLYLAEGLLRDIDSR